MKRDWDAAASITFQLMDIVEKLHVLALASEGFGEGTPGGVEELYNRANELANEWHVYSASFTDEVKNE